MRAVKIMINGLPGNVTSTIAGHALQDPRIILLPHSLTGPEIQADRHTISGSVIELIRPADRNEKMDALIKTHGDFISVDFTHPSAVNDNAEFYCEKSCRLSWAPLAGTGKN